MSPKRQQEARGSTAMQHVRDLLASRAAHVAAIAGIDGQLNEIFELLAADRPAAVPPVPARPSNGSTARRAAAARRPVADEPEANQPQGRITCAQRQERFAQIRDAVLVAVRSGLTHPEKLRVAAKCSKFQFWRAAKELVESGRIVSTGKSRGRRYQLPAGQQPQPRRPEAQVENPPPPLTPSGARGVAAIRARVGPREDEELETVWSPSRHAKSLIGDRVQRSRG
jgi:hypothetical protein